MRWALLTSTKRSKGEDVVLECFYESGHTGYFYLTSEEMPTALKDTEIAPLSAKRFEEIFKPGSRHQFAGEIPTIQIEVSQKPPIGSIWIQWEGNRPLTYHFDDVPLYLGELAR